MLEIDPRTGKRGAQRVSRLTRGTLPKRAPPPEVRVKGCVDREARQQQRGRITFQPSESEPPETLQYEHRDIDSASDPVQCTVARK